jgi:signal transduction histidine kinase
MHMPYSRFYVRTAFYIGGALAAFVLIGAASLGLIAAWELRGYIETRESTLGEQAAAVLAAQGEAGLIDWLNEEADIPDNVSIFILNEQSDDLLGKPVPEEYAQFIKDSVIGTAKPDISNYEPVRLAPRITSPDGTRYAFLIIPKGISLWGSEATLIGLLLVAIMVIASVAWLIARTINRPVSELQIAVRELASGDIRARVPVSISGRRDELGALAADFNRMAQRLQQLIENRESLFQEMSHELRSPLARLQAAIELAAQQNTAEIPERARIETEIARMNQVIGDMLRYSSLDAQVTVKQQLLRVNRKLAEIVAAEQVEAQKANCQLQLTAEPELTVIGDPELIGRGFENIIRNAIRFAPEGSTINIGAQRIHSSDATDTIRVTITDRGPGVPQEHLKKIFDPYFKLNHNKPGVPSSGLGLAIVKRVFEQHGGSVRAKNNQPSGLAVIVNLPAAALS